MSKSLVYHVDSAGNPQPASTSSPLPVGPGPSGPMHNRYNTSRAGKMNFTWPLSQNILRVKISGIVAGYPGNLQDFFSRLVINPPTTAIGDSWLAGAASLTADYMPLAFYPGQDLEIITRDPITSIYMQAVVYSGLYIAAATDIAATASGLTSTTSNLNFNQPGRKVLVSGFATATNNGWFTVKEATATSMTFEEPMTAEAAGAAVTADSGLLNVYIEAQEG